jgi:serine/threonine protein kinase
LLKLVDFGISHELEGFNPRSVGGSAGYMDPSIENLRRGLEEDMFDSTKSEVWAAGIS